MSELISLPALRRSFETLTPSTDELQEPSTEKEPGEEPKAAPEEDQQPSHEAVGIGVIGRPQTDLPEDPGR